MGAIKDKYPNANRKNNPYKEGSAHYNVFEACASDKGITLKEIISLAPNSREIYNARMYIYNINRECKNIQIDEVEPELFKMTKG